jgi:hypothetical protein
MSKAKLNPESYEDRISDIHDMLSDDVSLYRLTEKCMDMKVQEFNKLEDFLMILHESGNEDGIAALTEELMQK